MRGVGERPKPGIQDRCHNSPLGLLWCRGQASALQVALGLLHLHRRLIVHLDIKPHNILLDESWCVLFSGAQRHARQPPGLP